MRRPAFSIDFDGEKGEARDRFGEKYFGKVKGGFCWGFCDFVVFCGGEIVVSLWWNAWFLWCVVWWLLRRQKHASFLRFIFGVSRFGNRLSGGKAYPRGFKTPFPHAGIDAKPERLAYLEATATPDCLFRWAE